MVAHWSDLLVTGLLATVSVALLVPPGTQKNICIDGPIFIEKNHQRIYEKTMSILYNMEEKNVSILQISGVRAILLLLFDSKTPNLSNDKWKSVQLDQY